MNKASKTYTQTDAKRELMALAKAAGGGKAGREQIVAYLVTGLGIELAPAQIESILDTSNSIPWVWSGIYQIVTPVLAGTKA